MWGSPTSTFDPVTQMK